MRSPLLALATCNALQGSTRPPTRLQSNQRPPTRLRARPDDCPAEVWERIVEAEQQSREKKGQIGAALWGLDKGAIEQNQLRIWEELRERQESGAKPTKKPEPAPSNNPSSGIMKRGRVPSCQRYLSRRARRPTLWNLSRRASIVR